MEREIKFIGLNTAFQTMSKVFDELGELQKNPDLKNNISLQRCRDMIWIWINDYYKDLHLH